MKKSESRAKNAPAKIKLTAANKIRRLKKMIRQGAKLDDRLGLWESKK
jgi:hypothetical protein